MFAPCEPGCSPRSCMYYTEKGQPYFWGEMAIMWKEIIKKFAYRPESGFHVYGEVSRLQSLDSRKVRESRFASLRVFKTSEQIESRRKYWASLTDITVVTFHWWHQWHPVTQHGPRNTPQAGAQTSLCTTLLSWRGPSWMLEPDSVEKASRSLHGFSKFCAKVCRRSRVGEWSHYGFSSLSIG